MRVIEVDTGKSDDIADALCSSGACVLDQFVTDEEAVSLLTEAKGLDAAGRFNAARVGQGLQLTEAQALRGDRTCWIESGTDSAGGRFLQRMEALASGLRDALRMPIHGIEAHYAIYPHGGRYIRHRDRMQSDGARMVSWVTYLNDGWQPTDGGRLRLYSDDGTHADIEPIFGRSICFLSELEHEVLDAHATRYSIAGWMRRMD